MGASYIELICIIEQINHLHHSSNMSKISHKMVINVLDEFNTVSWKTGAICRARISTYQQKAKIHIKVFSEDAQNQIDNKTGF